MNVSHILFALTVNFSALRFKGRGKTDFKGYLKVVFFKHTCFRHRKTRRFQNIHESIVSNSSVMCVFRFQDRPEKQIRQKIVDLKQINAYRLHLKLLMFKIVFACFFFHLLQNRN